MENKAAKKWLFYFLSLIIVLPPLERAFPVIKSKGLTGVSMPTENIKFRLSTWFDGSYEKQKTLYINDNIGFRPDLIRMSNQIEFWLFKKLHAENAYIGHDNYLFDKEYVDEYEGVTYMGAEVARKELIKMKCIQDTLERLGKTFVFAYAPSKPYYIPEKIPDLLKPNHKRTISDYETFRAIGDSLKIKQLDYNALFMAMKDTTRNPIILKQGYHWSVYGSLLAADTMIKFIEKERKIKMPELKLTAMHYSETARDEDNDFVKFANLMFPITKETYCYPDFLYYNDGTKTRPKTIYIGDSFTWQWIHFGFMQSTNSEWEFWYYFKSVWNQKIIDVNGESLKIANYNWQKQLSGTDCVVVLFTPRNLHLLAEKSSFVEKMYDYFYPGKQI